ncbi:hypothetical protein Hypma_013557 [Hypsizygus marmoreus]|uniref:Protein RTA1 n=1 Tax=Hypsizygus marmoreus TaxID=39966 RepID=A0A369JIJ1_HYPMA|nr:hypothetical protein Hypma_013557 [Hypsizygus marmoreus]
MSFSPSTMSDVTDYAAYFGIESTLAAAVFAVLYLLLFAWFVQQSFNRPNDVFFTITFFYTIRMISFIIRAVIAGSHSAGHNLGLVITDQVLFNIGYFGLLYSAHALVLDRELVSQVPLPNNIVSRIVRFRTWYKAVLLEGVFLNFLGLWKITRFNPNDMPLVGNSTVISLVLVVLVAFHTVVLARTEFHRGAYHHGKESLVAKYGTYILVVISMLLIIREVFATATMWNLAKHNKEHFWYPLIALPEIFAVILYMTPDLVPLRSEVPESGSGVL